MPDIVQINIPKPAPVAFKEEWLRSIEAGAPLDPNALYRQIATGPLGSAAPFDPLQFTRDGRTVAENYLKSPAGEEITVSPPGALPTPPVIPGGLPTPPAAPTGVVEGLPDYYLRWYGADLARLITRKAGGGWNTQAADAARAAGIRIGEGLANPTRAYSNRTNQVLNLVVDQAQAEARATGKVSGGTYNAFLQAAQLNNEAVDALAGQLPGYRAPTAEQVALGLTGVAAAKGDLESFRQGLETVLKVQQGEAGPDFLSEFRVRSVPHTIDVKSILEKLPLKPGDFDAKLQGIQAGNFPDLTLDLVPKGKPIVDVVKAASDLWGATQTGVFSTIPLIGSPVSALADLLSGRPAGSTATYQLSRAVEVSSGGSAQAAAIQKTIQQKGPLGLVTDTIGSWFNIPGITAPPILDQKAVPTNLNPVNPGGTIPVPSKPFWQFW